MRPSVWPALDAGQIAARLRRRAVPRLFPRPICRRCCTSGTILEFFASQRRMITIMTGVSAAHPYPSLWFTGRRHDAAGLVSLPRRRQRPARNGARAIRRRRSSAWPIRSSSIAGEAAMLAAAVAWIVRRDADGDDRHGRLFSRNICPWALNPKGLEFFYYYFPSLLCLGPALALAFFRGGRPRIGRRSAFSSRRRSRSPSSCRFSRRSFLSIPTPLPRASGSTWR